MAVVVATNGRVPSALPPILKNYTKAAIRTQPGDLIAWSYAYFRSLVDGESPPAKEQIEFPMPSTESGISPGLLRVLHKKLRFLEAVPRSKFEDLCHALGVKEWAAKAAWKSSGSEEEAEWDNLLIGLISQESKSVQEQLSSIMQTVTEDFISKEVQLETVLKYFDFIHTTDEDDDKTHKLHEDTKDYLKEVASYQNGNLFPNDLSRPSFPLNELDN